jgi:hypothetical protein
VHLDGVFSPTFTEAEFVALQSSMPWIDFVHKEDVSPL